MNLKATRHNLKKIEQLLQDQFYTVRYERGNFVSGYCMVENSKIAVINKFLDIEARMQCLLEIFSQIDVDPRLFSPASKKFYKSLSSIYKEKNNDEAQLALY